jgi:hypothetical protein
MFFFCNTLVYRPLFHLARLRPIERTLFRSHYIMWQLGINARQIAEGFYETVEGQRSFAVQAIADAFAKSTGEDFFDNQQQMLRRLWAYCPGQFRSALWVMDSVHCHVPQEVHTPAQAFKVCVLGIWQVGVMWPLLWLFVPPGEAEITVGRQLIATAEVVLGEETIQHLLVDRGYVRSCMIIASAGPWKRCS